MSQYIIQEETLTAIADAIRGKIDSGAEANLLPQVVESTGVLVSGAVICQYRIFNNSESYVDTEEKYTHYSYNVHPLTGKTVPVLYETVDNQRSDGDDQFWYDGRVVYNNNIYDSWQAISDMYTLEGPYTQHIYTNIITYIEGEEIPTTQFAPLIESINTGSTSSSINLHYHKAIANQTRSSPKDVLSWTNVEMYELSDLDSNQGFTDKWLSFIDGHTIEDDYTIAGTDIQNSSTWTLILGNDNPYYYLHCYFEVYEIATQDSGEGQVLRKIAACAPPSGTIEVEVNSTLSYFWQWGSVELVGIRYSIDED